MGESLNSKYKHLIVEVQKLNYQEKILLFGEPTKKYKALDSSRRLTLTSDINNNLFQMLSHHIDEINEKKKKAFKCYLISIDSPYKLVWDHFMCFLVAWSNIITAYHIAFNPSSNIGSEIVNIFIELCFFFDMISKFFREYRNSQNLDVVSTLTETSKIYLKSWFIIDFIALIPLHLILSRSKQKNDRIYYINKLLRLTRIPQFMTLFEIKKFDNLLELLLEKGPANASNERSRQEKVNIKYIARYVYMIIRLVVMSVLLTYFLGCLWYLVSYLSTPEDGMLTDPKANTFYARDLKSSDPNYVRAIKCCYFVLTTLATIGYGDLTPKSNIEKVFAIVLMILGIGFFSYIMGNFNDIFASYDKEMNTFDKSTELHAWLASLAKFINKKPLPRVMLKKIDDHFKYFWRSSRLSNITMNDKYLSQIPNGMRHQLINYLFDDIFLTFKAFLHQKNFKNIPEFYYEIAFLFLPRKFESHQMILKQGGNVEEIYFLLEGEVDVWFELENRHKIHRYFGKGYFFGDYNSFNDKKAEYNYTATTFCKMLALPKYKFLRLLDKFPEIKKTMIDTAAQLRFQTRNRFIKMLDNYYNPRMAKQDGQNIIEPSNKRMKDHDLLKILNQCVGERSKNARESINRAGVAVQFSMKTLDEIEAKLKEVDKFLRDFEQIYRSFQEFIDSESDDIRKNLELIRSQLVQHKY